MFPSTVATAARLRKAKMKTTRNEDEAMDTSGVAGGLAPQRSPQSKIYLNLTLFLSSDK